ncbi:MAG: hypothetical protein HZA46_11045 [Planctomycetales bacterium]|nr:hypothetical protein [Planctomycetales bacterium]
MYTFKTWGIGTVAAALLLTNTIRAGEFTKTTATQAQVKKEEKTAFFPFFPNGGGYGSCAPVPCNPCRPVVQPIPWPAAPCGGQPYYRPRPYAVPYGGGYGGSYGGSFGGGYGGAYGGYSYPTVPAPIYSAPMYSVPSYPVQNYSVPGYGAPGYFTSGSAGSAVTSPVFNSLAGYNGVQNAPAYLPAIDSPYFP